MLSEITPLILTYNEEPNLARCLRQLGWAREIVVLDSGSTDGTQAIAAAHPNVRWLTRPFDSFAEQCNFGLSQIRSEWVLSMDADYVLTDEFVAELRTHKPMANVAGFAASFRYLVNGQPLRACLYPPRTVLYRRGLASYQNDGHAHRVKIDGVVQPLGGRILHDDRKPFSRWLWAQNNYTEKEVAKLTSAKPGELRLQDRLRRLILIAPPLVLAYTLLVRGLILDGWPGWHYALQRTLAELLLSLKLIELKFSGQRPPGQP